VICQDELIRALFLSRDELLAYIRTFVLNRHVAEDIHQDVAVLALQKADKIENVKHLMFWARSVAKSYAFDYLRKQNRQARHIDPSVIDLLEHDFDAIEVKDVSKEAAALTECLKELTPRAKSLLKLKFTEEMDSEQISKKLGMKVDSVYGAFWRIYRALNECIRSKTSNAQTG
jgi:RNA polymerase sigma factor (sigma-70 family)